MNPDIITSAIETLNDALSRDADAITKLVNARPPCNEHLANHPVIRAGDYDGTWRIGFLGVLNGVLGYSAPAIGAEGTIDASGRFQRIRRFVDLRKGVDLRT